MSKDALYNKKNKEQLLEDLQQETFNRITISFYKYTSLNNLEDLRDKLYKDWLSLKILGRIYIAYEGINAQISLPEYMIEKFKNYMNTFDNFKDIKYKIAVQEGLSFLKLTIKIKNEIVAYKIPEDQYDMGLVGNHLNYKEFNKAIDDGAVIVDMRNYYEGEIGKFNNAIIPDVDRSQDLLPEIKKLLKNYKNDKVLMYCTGGIRCEKASAYLLHHGFKDVNQLDGGIVKYANDIKKNNVQSKFIGKNFVFDQRLAESITDDVLSTCHMCKNKCDTHTNCLNQDCHILFIQCKTCSRTYNGCCSEKCSNFIQLPRDEQRQLFKSGKISFNAQKSSKTKPKLYELE